MCGRYGRYSAAEAYAGIIDAMVSKRLDDTPSYNRPPGTFQLVGLLNPDNGEAALGPAWWGFIPNWAIDTKLSSINARSETAADKKLFAKAFERQRCLVAADYWIEWQRGERGKQPFAIRPSEAEPFFFAGIWSKAAKLPDDHPASGEVTFAILTGEPNDDIAHIHNRQPQALTAEASRAWIDPDTGPAHLSEILFDGRYSSYESWPVDKRVGKLSEDDAAILDRVRN